MSALFLFTSCSKDENLKLSTATLGFTSEIIPDGTSYMVNDYTIMHTSDLRSGNAFYWKGDSLFIPASKVVISQIGDREFTENMSSFFIALAFVEGVSKRSPELLQNTSTFLLHTQGQFELTSDECFIISDESPFVYFNREECGSH